MKATIFLQYEKQRYVHAVIRFLFVKFLPAMVLANALEKAGTGAFSDSGADLNPEILKFELKLTLKLTLRLISRSRIEESDLLEGAGLLVVVVGAGVVVNLVLCESLSSSSLARSELIGDKGTSCNSWNLFYYSYTMADFPSKKDQM